MGCFIAAARLWQGTEKRLEIVRDGGGALGPMEQGIFKEGNREDFVKIGKALMRLPRIIS